MKSKGKAVSTAATVRNGLEIEGNTAPCESVCDSITENDYVQGFIESFLQYGAANAIPTDKLMELTGLDLRQLQKAVEAERRNGVLILTKPQGGYFLPGEGEAGKAEIRTFYNIQRSKALSLVKTIKAAREALEDIDGQETLDFSV